MTLHRIEEIQRDSADRVVRRSFRYVEAGKGETTRSRPAVQRHPAAGSQEESDLVKELRTRVATLEERVAQLEARPEMPPASTLPASTSDTRELARALQDGLKRIVAIEAQVARTSDHGTRLANIEEALGALAVMSEQVAAEKSAD